MNFGCRSLSALLLFQALVFSQAARGQAAGQDIDFACGGRVEAEAWNLWDQKVRSPFQQEMLQERLLQQGDTYALYDMQLYSHSLWSMAQQCKRTDRLREAATMVRTAYQALRSAPAPQTGRAWICRGGTICAENDLLNTEVKLVTFQFLGLASFIANALATSEAPLTPEDRLFIGDTITIVNEHMTRWASDYEINRLQRVARASVSELKSNDSFLLFSDQDLWQLAIYAELAGLRRWQALQGIESATPSDTRLKNHLNALLQAFSARISINRSNSARIPETESADLDRGFWKRMAGNTYAGYEGRERPVVCAPARQVRVAASAAAPKEDTGWDLSHARRLVQALDAFDRNRAAMKTMFSLTDARLPSPTLSRAFAATLINGVWNGDMVRPLFANYWSGANGWFGTYSNATGCSEGIAPYGMTDSFPTGGYITWSRHVPLVGALGRRLYDLVGSTAPDDRQFIETYYPNLGKSVPAQYGTLYTTMFLSSLVSPLK